jgi:hypothetical protein
LLLWEPVGFVFGVHGGGGGGVGVWQSRKGVGTRVRGFLLVVSREGRKILLAAGL